MNSEFVFTKRTIEHVLAIYNIVEMKWNIYVDWFDRSHAYCISTMRCMYMHKRSIKKKFIQS